MNVYWILILTCQVILSRQYEKTDQTVKYIVIRTTSSRDFDLSDYERFFPVSIKLTVVSVWVGRTI